MNPLNKDDAELLVRCILAEKQKLDIKEDLSDNVLAHIVKKRIEVLNLPIKFTNIAYLAVNCFCKNPGHVVALLIDALTKYEGKEVTVEMLCDLYPKGFYTQSEFEDYVDTKLKPKTVKWSEIY